MLTQNPEYFIAIVQSGNMSKAAEKLFVSQSSLSQYLKRLETSLNVMLFDRSVSPMQLTGAGQCYYDYALRWRDSERAMQAEISCIRQELTGTLHLGIAMWRGACLIPDIFPSFHTHYPGIRLEVFEGRFVQMKHALMNHEIDLAIVNLLPNGSYEEFETEGIMRERILLAAPTKNPIIQKHLETCQYDREIPIISMDILRQLPVVLTKKGQSLTEMLLRSFARNQITPNVLLETANLTTAINLTAKGLCCCFVPEEGARTCQHPGSVTYFVVDDSELYWHLAFLYRKKQPLNSFAKLFVDHTKKMLF